MTIKEAILKSLRDIQKPAKHSEVCKHIIEKKYYDFGLAKTPCATVSTLLGDFIRKNDSRVKRIKLDATTYSYYLKELENNIPINMLTSDKTILDEKKGKITKGYSERNLHKLLATFLKSQNIFSTTIFHEESKNSNDDYQKWIHPDMIGVSFSKYKSKTAKNLVKALDGGEVIHLLSYELKKEIKTDYELKKCFFQAVSNSSWSDFGYLVVLEISDNIIDELERLNNSFGIGVIILKANPFKSQILFQARKNKIDYQTIDKLCNVNTKYGEFVSKIEAVLTASEKYLKASEKELFTLYDNPLKDEEEALQYCIEHNIPHSEKDFE